MRDSSSNSRAMAFLALPWNGFVSAFLYYTVLALVAVSGEGLSSVFMVVAYGLPLAVYAALLASRALKALAAIEIVPLHASGAAAR